MSTYKDNVFYDSIIRNENPDIDLKINSIKSSSFSMGSSTSSSIPIKQYWPSYKSISYDGSNYFISAPLTDYDGTMYHLIMYSPNGSNWSAVTPPTPPNYNLYTGFCYDSLNERNYLIGINGSNSTIYYINKGSITLSNLLSNIPLATFSSLKIIDNILYIYGAQGKIGFGTLPNLSDFQVVTVPNEIFLTLDISKIGSKFVVTTSSHIYTGTSISNLSISCDCTSNQSAAVFNNTLFVLDSSFILYYSKDFLSLSPVKQMNTTRLVVDPYSNILVSFNHASAIPYFEYSFDGYTWFQHQHDQGNIGISSLFPMEDKYLYISYMKATFTYKVTGISIISDLVLSKNLSLNGELNFKALTRSEILSHPKKSGTVLFMEDPTYGKAIVYCDGSSWLKVSNPTLV